MSDSATDVILDEIIDAVVEEIAPGATVTRRPFVYATSFRLEEIEISRSGGPSRRLVAKHLGREAMSDAARLAKPTASHAPQRQAMPMNGGWASTAPGATAPAVPPTAVRAAGFSARLTIRPAPIAAQTATTATVLRRRRRWRPRAEAITPRVAEYMTLL